jgi:hypothetical protein
MTSEKEVSSAGVTNCPSEFHFPAFQILSHGPPTAKMLPSELSAPKCSDEDTNPGGQSATAREPPWK